MSPDFPDRTEEKNAGTVEDKHHHTPSPGIEVMSPIATFSENDTENGDDANDD
jgi:hypothetical protein